MKQIHMQYHLGCISKNRVENDQQNGSLKFHLSNEENQCRKIQNIYLNLNLVLLWISSFKRLMKEQEFQECFCRFLPFSYTCSQYPDTTYCRLQIKSGMQTSEGSQSDAHRVGIQLPNIGRFYTEPICDTKSSKVKRDKFLSKRDLRI